MKQAAEQTAGYIFACTSKSEQECFDRLLFATSRVYGESVLKIKKGDTLFLLNLDTDTLYGTFSAKSAGAKNIVPEAWNGKYPYQVQVSPNGKMHSLQGAKKLLSGISWRDNLDTGQ